MNSKDLQNLQEAYDEIYQLDELSDKKVQRVVDARNRRSDRSIDSGAPNKEFYQARRSNQLAARRNARTGSNVRVDPILSKEEADIYDIILSYLLDEGYAETLEAAEAIMVNMSEEWRECIVEGEVKYDKKQHKLDNPYHFREPFSDTPRPPTKQEKEDHVQLMKDRKAAKLRMRLAKVIRHQRAGHHGDDDWFRHLGRDDHKRYRD